MFRIGKLFHLTQVVDDLERIDRWHDDVFAAERFYHGYEELAGRDAASRRSADGSESKRRRVAAHASLPPSRSTQHDKAWPRVGEADGYQVSSSRVALNPRVCRSASSGRRRRRGVGGPRPEAGSGC